MIDLTAKIDNDEALRKLRQLQQTAKQTTSSVVTDADRMDMAMARLGRTLGQLGVGISLAGLVRQVGQVRGEFQKLEIAFSTMLQSESKATALMAQLTRTAATTPFGLQDVANGAKQLLAYGTEAEKVNEILIRLGDIAAGLSIPLGDLVYLYGTTQTQGRLFTQDLRQFQGRGIPLAEELAKQFKVTSAEVGKLVTAGKIGFPEVEKAIISMTSQGGKFGGLMEAQSKTINGLVSNLEDAFDVMFNEIGQKTEGAFVGTLQTAIQLVENYEKVLDILIPLASAYGTYKAAIIAVTAAQKAMLAVDAAKSFAVMARNIGIANAAMKSLNLTMAASPWALLGALVVGAGVAVYKFAKNSKSAEKAVAELHEGVGKEVTALDDAFGALENAKKGTNEYKDAIVEINSKYGSYFENQLTEKSNADEIAKAYDRVKNAIIGASLERAKSAYLEEPTGNLAKSESKVIKRLGDSGLVNQMNDFARGVWSRNVEKLIADVKSSGGEMSLEETKKQLTDILRSARELSGLSFTKENEKYYNIGLSGVPLERLLEDVKAMAQAENAFKEFASGYTAEDKKTVVEDPKKTLSDEEKERLKKLAQLRAELSVKAAQAEVDAMKEGLPKVLAQIDLDYDQREAEIRKREEELRAIQGGKLTDEQTAAFGALRKGNTAQRQSERMNAMYVPMDIDLGALWEREEQAMNDYLKEYGSWEQKRLAIAEEYQGKINQATNEWDVKILTKQMEEALSTLDESMVEKSDLWTRLFADASRMTRSQLKSVISDTKKLLDYLNGSSDQKPNGFTDTALENLKKQPEVIKDIYDALNEKQREFEENNKYPFSNIINGINAMREANILAQKAASATDKKTKDQLQQQALEKKGQALNYMQAGAAGAASALSDLSQKLQEVADSTSNNSIKEAAEQFNSVAQNFSAAAQGFAQGGWVGAIVGGATDMLNQTIEAFANDRAEREEERQNALDFAREYTMLMLSLKEEDYETLFGAHGLEMAIDAYKKAKEALLEYTSIVNKAMGKPGYDDEANSLGSLVFGGLWLGKSQTDLSAKLIEAYEKGYTELQAMMVKTRDRSGWANFWGKKDRYTALKDLAPELWDEDGEFNIDAAKAFLETNTQITEEQRKQIEHIIELREQYDSLIEAIDEQISGIFGDLATDLTDIIFDSVRNGTDAWDAFNERGSEVINNLGKQMVQEMFVQAYLDQWVESLRDAFSGEDTQDVTNRIADITKRMFGGMGAMFEGASAAAAAWDEAAKAAGWDVDAMVKGQEATSKGFQTMDQETGSELNGRFTDMQGKMAEQLGLSRQAIERMEYIRNLSEQQLHTQIDTRDILINISGNVSEIRAFSEALPLIHEAVTKTNKILDDRL